MSAETPDMTARRYYRALKATMTLEHEAMSLDRKAQEQAIRLRRWAYDGLMAAADRAGWRVEVTPGPPPFEDDVFFLGRSALKVLKPHVAPRRQGARP